MSRLADEGAGGRVGAASLRRLLFADFTVPGAEPRRYVEVTDFVRLTAVVTEYLSELNAGGWGGRGTRAVAGMHAGAGVEE